MDVLRSTRQKHPLAMLIGVVWRPLESVAVLGKGFIKAEDIRRLVVRRKPLYVTATLWTPYWPSRVIPWANLQAVHHNENDRRLVDGEGFQLLMYFVVHAVEDACERL